MHLFRSRVSVLGYRHGTEFFLSYLILIILKNRSDFFTANGLKCFLYPPPRPSCHLSFIELQIE